MEMQQHTLTADSAVAQVHAAARALSAMDVSSVDAVRAVELHRRLKEASDQVQAVAARLTALIEADGRWSAGGSPTFPEWLARRQLSSVGAARQEVTLGRALDGALPGTATAVASGAITLEHAQVLARLAPTSELRRAALASDRPDQNEAYLLARASTTPVDDYRREVRRWAARVDAAAAERGHERAAAKEYLTLSPRDDGVAVQGFLTVEHGAVLRAALRAVTGVPAADDRRAPEERSAAALGALSRLVLDRGLAGGGGAQLRPHLSVHVSWETMQGLVRAAEGVDDDAGVGAGSGPAELDDGEPIPASVLARLACDSDISRVVFGPQSQVIDVGRTHRTYSGQLRRAVIARDRTCRHPGCSAPPTLGEVHHVIPWARGGGTSLANGILLCWYHHDLVHRRGTRIDRDDGGGWRFRRADGGPLAVEGGGTEARAA
jgi:hypothetical protein